MATQLPDAVLVGMEDLNCNLRFTSETTNGILMNTCWVTDLSTGITYAKGVAENEVDAAVNAINTARVTSKPLTKAQAQFGGVLEENARLRAELAALKGEPVPPPPSIPNIEEDTKPRARSGRKVEIV